MAPMLVIRRDCFSPLPRMTTTGWRCIAWRQHECAERSALDGAEPSRRSVYTDYKMPLSRTTRVEKDLVYELERDFMMHPCGCALCHSKNIPSFSRHGDLERPGSPTPTSRAHPPQCIQVLLHLAGRRSGTTRLEQSTPPTDGPSRKYFHPDSQFPRNIRRAGGLITRADIPLFLRSYARATGFTRFSRGA